MFLTFLLFSFAHAASPDLSGWEKWDVECHDRSIRFHYKAPTELLDAVCAIPTGNAAKYPMSYRQLHAVVAEAFLAKQSDQQAQARRMIASYKCENEIACETLRELIESYEKNPEVKQNRGSLKWAKQMQKKVPRRSPKSSKVTGLCLDTSERAYWLERVYELYCPLKPTATNPDGCANLTDVPKSCSTTEALRDDLETVSGQKFMSASYLSNLYHEGMNDCQGKWLVNLVCGPGEKHFKVGCEKSGKRVKCKETTARR